MAVAISSEKGLEAWLKGKPPASARMIALRVALIVAPLVVDPGQWRERRPLETVALGAFRALSIAFAVGGESDETQRRAAQLAARSLRALHAAFVFVDSGGISSACENSIKAVCAAADAVGSEHPEADTLMTVRCAVAAAEEEGVAGYSHLDLSQSAAAGLRAATVIWQSVSLDCELLETVEDVKRLFDVPVWGNAPDWLDQRWYSARRWLISSEANFDVWEEWYLRRLRGYRSSFSDFTAASDWEFAKRLSAQDDTWWDREPAEVNAEIARWVEELRLPAPPTDEELEQNPRAINFGPNTDGQVALAARRDPDKLDTSERACARHAEVRANAHEALEQSRAGKTQATEIEPVLEAYLQSLGEHPGGVDAPLLIARGEKLRRLISLRRDPESSAVPFAEGQNGALEDWLATHNLFVGFDAYLSAVERIARGPDADPTVLDLEALKRVIQSARDANLPTDDAAQALDDVADNVPPDAAPDDRRLAQATEALKNFIRAVGLLVKEHRWKVGLGGLGAAYGAASWVQRNIPWLRDVFGDEPSILSILESIAALPL